MEPGAEQWERVKNLFDAALERSPAEREQFLSNSCTEEGIRAEVLSLLRNHDSASGFLPSVAESVSVDAAIPTSAPALSLKTRLGPYEITAFLGAGGMGEVYRARDTRLDRSVAIKVLPAEFSDDRERLRRFEQEARAVAALNHPNILALYDIGSQSGTSFVVSELLEGGTLRERLASGALSPRKAVEYAVQVAKGLSTAHDEGIVHRDLKPDNIFITKDGRVKILDFGLAKLTSRSGAHERSTIPGSTTPGVVMGTAGYMSPEQVRGENVNHLSDIFSFGVVLYEMLSGQRAFKRDTPLETMSAILKEEPPDLTTSEAKTPPSLSRIVRHCLEKNPEERFQSARDLAFHLEAVPEVLSLTSPVTVVGARRPSWLQVIACVTLGVLVIGIVTGWIFRAWSPTVIPVFHQVTFRRGSVGQARFTPDGATAVYSARWSNEHARVYMTRGDSPESLALAPPSALLESIWPPGEMLVHIDSKGKDVLARVPLTGGGPRPIFENVNNADVSPVDHQCAIVRAALAGKNQLEYPPGKVIYSTAASIPYIRFAPDGRSLALVEWPIRDDDAGWVTILDLTGRKKASSSQFGSIRGLAWKPRSKEVWFTGARPDTIRNLYAINISGKERLVYRAPSSLTIKDMAADGRVLLTRDDVRFGITGKSASDPSERDFSGFDFSLAIDVSTDGKTMLFEEGGSEEGTFVMYLRSADGQSPVRLGPGSAQALSPDGKWVLAVTGKSPSQLTLVPVGAGENRVLTNDSLNHTAAAWFPDSKRVLFEGNESGKPLRLYVQGIDGGPVTALTPPGSSFLGHLIGQHVVSPDGKSVIAFAPDWSVAIYDVESGSSHPPKGWGSDDQFVRWAEQRSEVYVSKEIPSIQPLVRIYRLNVMTGKRILTKEISIPDPAGFSFVSLLLAPDAESYFYTYTRQLSTLFLVDGLK
jgi:eukaryotic-like serine/threonine-protein kinase